jgi:hypothetical protein
VITIVCARSHLLPPTLIKRLTPHPMMPSPNDALTLKSVLECNLTQKERRESGDQECIGGWRSHPADHPPLPSAGQSCICSRLCGETATPALRLWYYNIYRKVGLAGSSARRSSDIIETSRNVRKRGSVLCMPSPVPTSPVPTSLVPTSLVRGGAISTQSWGERRRRAELYQVDLLAFVRGSRVQPHPVCSKIAESRGGE